MAIVAPIAGPYTSTYNSNALNWTTNGFELEHQTKAEMVQESDLYGDSIIDGIVRGGNVYCTFECGVYTTANAIPAFYPFGALGTMATTAAPVGRRFTDIAAAMVLTAVANTPAAATPATLTGSKAILPPDSNLKLLFTSKVRKVPMRLLFLPSESGGNVTWFSTSALWWLMGLTALALSALGGLSSLA